MSDTREAVQAPSARPPDVLWLPFAVLVLLGLRTTLAVTAYLVIALLGLASGTASMQRQVFPFGIGMLALGTGALLCVAALWRQRRRARTIAVIVLPLFVAAGAADGLIVNESRGLRLNPFSVLSLLLPVVAWVILFLPSVCEYYGRL